MAEGGMDEVLKAFLQESTEGLARMEEDLVRLEQNPSDAATLDSIFRAVHTIKGTCGFLGFGHLESFTHAAEDVLALLREGALPLSLELVGALLQLVDVTRDVLALIEETGEEGQDDHAALTAVFVRLRDGSADGPVPEAVRQADDGERVSAVSDSAVRVDVGLLDKLMNVVGELVLARNQILQCSGVRNDPVLQAVSQRLNHITGELQDGVMQTRMQPISTIWASFPRLVRDLEQHTGKRVRLEREGGDTGLDRSLLQAIKDPLTHLVRNAIDHGLEGPGERVRQGKPETGVLRLRAYHESGYVVIDISDDGAGVNIDAVRDRAIVRGLASADQMAGLDERDILAFLFRPGFSTAAQVTNISGRGVGLDVVRNNVERAGGSVDIQTRPGSGTSFKLRLPLTLAIIPALIVTCQEARFAVPQVNVLEILYVEGEDRPEKIESVHASLVYRLRGRLLPLVDLRQILALPERPGNAALYILVLQADNRLFGLLVDTVRDTEEIVVKPLGRQLKDVDVFAGATIMGDGRVALILDATAVAQRAHVLTESLAGTQSRNEKAAGEEAALGKFLIFRMGEQGFAGIPLAQVQRLEEFDSARIERSLGCEVVQYHDEILPLVRLGELMQTCAAEADDSLMQVVVHKSRQGSLGLVVDHIVDIVDDDVGRFQRQSGSPLVLGTAVVQGRITDLLDMERILQLSKGRFFQPPEALAPEPGHG